MTEKPSFGDRIVTWWQNLTGRERLLLGALPFLALAGAAYTLNLETNARIESLVEAQQELQALGQAPAGAWLSARQNALAEREIVLAQAFTAINEASAREYVRGTLDRTAIAAGIPALTVQVRAAAPTQAAANPAGTGQGSPSSTTPAPSAPQGLQFLDVDMAGPFKWDTFLNFQTRLAAYREFTSWTALSFDETGDARFRATVRVAYVQRDALK